MHDGDEGKERNAAGQASEGHASDQVDGAPAAPTGPEGPDALTTALLDDLVAERAIRQVLARYCRGIDRHDMTLVRSCYHDDAVDEHGSFTGTADEYVAWAERLLGRYAMTMHMLAAPSVERTGDVALVETYGLSFHRSRPDEAGKAHLNLMTGFRFIDRFERRRGEWKIAHRIAVTEWSRVDDQPGRWPVPESLRHGTRDETDPVWWLVPELGHYRSGDDGAGAAVA